MKKLLVSIIAVVYFAISSGVVINMHYCMNRFDSAQLGAKTADYCSKCGMHTGKSKGCCHDEVKLIKLQQDQKLSDFSYVLQNVSPAISAPSQFMISPFPHTTELITFNT
ncbi:MAG: hypothetical protein JSU05_10980, partial [Bacteroidetes bacterium]|nr:hypothetical protein [Bacteroidota bacterium]